MDVRKRRRFTPFTAVLGIVLALYAVSMTALLLWGVFTALKTQEEFRRNVALIPSARRGIGRGEILSGFLKIFMYPSRRS